MRIVLINETCGTGSIGRATFELATALEEKGHECLVVYSGGHGKYRHCYRLGNGLDHKIHAIMSRLTGLQGYFSYHATRRLLKKLDEFRPDVVQLMNLHSNDVNLRLLLGYLAKKNIATVATLHDCWLFTGKCTHYIPAGCYKWQKECGSCPLLHVDNINPTFWFDRTKKCLNDKRRWFSAIPRLGVVGVSEWITGEAGKSIFADRKPVCIYNWIDLKTFRPRESELRKKFGLEGKFVVIAVAAYLSKKKGYDEIVALSERMADDWAIVAVGKAELPLPENVIHIDRTDDAVQLAQLYSMADVCMNTTRYETFGMVTAEAICCGTPAVVYRNTASPEIVGDDCGIAVDQNEGIDGIMRALNTVYQNGKARYTENCLRSAKTRFAMEYGVGKYIDLYRKLTDSGKGTK